MKRQYELTDKKIEELAGHFNKDGVMHFDKVVGILFDIPVQPYFYEDPDNYSIETRQDIIRFRILVNRLINYSIIGTPVYEKLTELQAETSEITNEIADLMIEDTELLKETTPLVLEFTELLEKLKRSGLK